MRKRILLSAIGGWLTVSAIGPGAKGSIILFDPDGPAGANPAMQIGAFDFLPGNALLQNSLTGAPTFPYLFHARLSNVLDLENRPTYPVGLNSAFEITVVARFQLTVTGQSTDAMASTTTLSVGAAPADFIELYFDDTPDANNLTGTGFNDGVRILRGVPTFGGGTFIEQIQTPSLTFDQFGANQYSGTLSRTGVGGLTLSGAVIDTDLAFFQPPLTVISLNTTTMNSMPFDKTDPSAVFWNGASFGSAAIGAVNGFTGPDTQMQTDAAVSFEVPEPVSLAFLGLAAVVANCGRFRRQCGRMVK